MAIVSLLSPHQRIPFNLSQWQDIYTKQNKGFFLLKVSKRSIIDIMKSFICRGYDEERRGCPLLIIFGGFNLAKPKVAKRPTRDEFVLEEIGNQLAEAFHEKSTLVLTVWGREEPVRGSISKMDSRTGKVHFETSEGTDKVPFMDIMSVNYPRD
jgi:hypothetical protein